MSLTPDEKTAGRQFRDEQQQALTHSFETDPPTYAVPNFLAHYRHNCPARNNTSTAMELKEFYNFSEEIDVGGTVIPSSRFGFIYKVGKCSRCKQTSRSRAGKFVDAYVRPPLQGRVARSS